MKKCCTCGLGKALGEFGKLMKASDGLSPRCKACWKVMHAEYRTRHPERVKAVKKKHYEANRDVIAAKAKPVRKAYREKNREAIALKKAEYRTANKTKVRAGQRRWELANPEKRGAYYRAAVERDPEAIRAQWQRNYNPAMAKEAAKRWKKRNPWAAAETQRRRVAAKLNAVPAWANRFFISEIYDLAARRTKVTGIEWHVDHIVPLQSKVACGLHCETNLAVVPARLNIAKGNKLVANAAEGAPWQMW